MLKLLSFFNIPHAIVILCVVALLFHGLNFLATENVLDTVIAFALCAIFLVVELKWMLPASIENAETAS